MTKKACLAAAIIALCTLLSACSGSGTRAVTPYLKAGERSSLESDLWSSVRISADTVSPAKIHVAYDNNSQYAISDFVIYRADNGERIYWSYLVPAESCTEADFYNGDQWSDIKKETENKFYFEYTIGDYTYTTEDVLLNEDNSPANRAYNKDITVSIDTFDGRITLQPDNTEEFSEGDEINGLKKSKIYSVSLVELSRNDFGFYTLGINVTGKRGDSGNTIYKLTDDNGTVYESSSLYFGNDGTVIRFYSIESGNYTLVFEESR